MENITAKIKTLFSAGLFHIFGSSFINNVIAFANSSLLSKIIDQESSGYYASSLIYLGYPLMLLGFGISAGLLQFTSERITEDEKKKLFKYGIKYSFIINLLLSLGLFLFTFLGIADPVIVPYIRFLSLFPVLEGFFQIFSIYLRVNRKNQHYSYMMNIDSVMMLVSILFSAYFFGWQGAVMSRYVAHIFSIAYFLYLYGKEIKLLLNAGDAPREKKVTMTKYSFVMMMSNMVSSLLTLIDQQLVSYLGMVTLGVYFYMTKIPNAMSFLPLSVMIFIYPHFAERNTDREWFKENTRKLFIIMGALNLLITISLYVTAPLIIRIIFKEEYIADGLGIFRVLSINYFFLSTFRIPAGNILAMLRKVKFNFYVSMITGLVNIALNFLMISKLGAIGASYAYLTTVLISSCIMMPYLIMTIRKLPLRNEVENPNTER